ncbi:MAG: hypothetical protein MZV64_00045 [Ignavibacteriales bacterium]|nr:hypothetical protein [Ignavibacteriales bacterium]
MRGFGGARVLFVPHNGYVRAARFQGKPDRSPDLSESDNGDLYWHGYPRKMVWREYYMRMSPLNARTADADRGSLAKGGEEKSPYCPKFIIMGLITA